jgi:hypothetical protein
MGDDLTKEEIEIRMRDAVSRALNTPPSPTKDLVGKTERAQIQRESREIRKPRKGAKPRD